MSNKKVMGMKANDAGLDFWNDLAKGCSDEELPALWVLFQGFNVLTTEGPIGSWYWLRVVGLMYDVMVNTLDMVMPRNIAKLLNEYHDLTNTGVVVVGE